MEISSISGEIFLSCMGLIIILVSVFANKEKTFNLAYRLSLFSFVISGIIILITHNDSGRLFQEAYTFDGLARYSKLLILFGASMALLIGFKALKIDNLAIPELPILFLFSVLGMLLMTSATDLISLYMSLELQSLPLYILAGIRKDNTKSSEAGLKYFILGALSSGIILYGMSLIYGAVGSTSFSSISLVINTEMSNLMLMGLIFIISGIAFKISAVPFHMWTPDVYEGSPTPVTAIFAIVPKIAAITVFIRLTFGVFENAISSWQQIIFILSILSMMLGSFAAIMQTNIKRLIAYSSIAHMGYALVGIASGIEEGLSSVLTYMFIYIVMSIGTFIIIISMRRDNQPVEEINDLKGFSKTHPFLSMSLLILMFSMAGIPPLAGFFGKWLVFSAAVKSGLLALTIIGVLTSVVGAFYYLKIVKIMYFEDVESPIDQLENKTVNFILFLMILLTLGFGLIMSWFLNIFVNSSFVL
mgnify:FL=1